MTKCRRFERVLRIPRPRLIGLVVRRIKIVHHVFLHKSVVAPDALIANRYHSRSTREYEPTYR
jgi:hypothetical protein